MVFRAYHNLPAETAAAKTSDGFLRSGDLGMLDQDGFLFITGRKKDMLIVSGQVSRDKKNGALKAAGWLNWLVDALELGEIEPVERQIYDCGWGTVDVRFPTPGEAESRREQATETLWEAARRISSEKQIASVRPPLLAQVPQEPDAPARTMTATEIADLGRWVYAENDSMREMYARRWRQKVLHDSPDQIQPISAFKRDHSRREVGEIVHKALRWWTTDMQQDAIRKRLDSYAWEAGIVNPQERREIVGFAEALMYKVVNSEMYAWIRAADPVYTELPFVFQTGKRLVHGVIDVLMRRSDGRWALVDYKTGFAAPNSDQAALREYSRRYLFQVGVYAAAAQELLGIDQIDVYIHYIRHEQTVEIPTNAWKDALVRLEDHIESLIGMAEL